MADNFFCRCLSHPLHRNTRRRCQLLAPPPPTWTRRMQTRDARLLNPTVHFFHPWWMWGVHLSQRWDHQARTFQYFCDIPMVTFFLDHQSQLTPSGPSQDQGSTTLQGNVWVRSSAVQIRPLSNRMWSWPVNSKQSSRLFMLHVFLFQSWYPLTFWPYECSATGNKGLYRHPIIQEVINEQWFSNRKDDGVKYSEVYKPFPKVALALVLAAVSLQLNFRFSSLTRITY